MGGFGSGRHGGSVTAEGTASYIIAISSLRSFLQKEECLTGTISFNEGRFPIVITVDSSKQWDAFVELIHLTRDEAEGDRVITDRAHLWGPTLVVSVPEDRPPHHKALSAEWRMAFLEPPSLSARLCLPARRAVRSPSAKSRKTEPPTRRRRLGQLGQPADEAEMDALANLRAEIRTLGASGRESQRGVCDTRRALAEIDLGSSPRSQP